MSFPFDLHSAAVSHSHLPCHAHAMLRPWNGHGMASVNQTRSHCVNQIGEAHSKPLAARHGRGRAWARHAMCESAFMGTRTPAVHARWVGR